MTRLDRRLITWWGLYQIGHLASNAWAAYWLLNTGQIGFPAPPPPGGWPSASMQVLLSMAVLDSLNAIASLVFIRARLQGEQHLDWLGGLTLALFNYAALLFALVTLLGGAWVGRNLPIYLAINLGYAPILWLALRWLNRSRRRTG